MKIKIIPCIFLTSPHTDAYKMAMKKLPKNIQSLFCASTQVNSYKRAVEELVFNSLDAESTSIAVRVNIEDNKIQVIDNGCGVAKCDFRLLGERYTTSKCVDLTTLQSASNTYGFRGQSLASIIAVSQRVTITSRCEKTEETWHKVFYEGKVQISSETTTRPSKGSTVEIKGFLYNLNIQRKAIDALNELTEIKTFLEQLSLVHSNISLSLRDDSKNEIVFQLHKKRDIFQTLNSLFGVYSTDVQELKVEKKQYKVTALIGSKDREISQYHWIYLNRKLVHNCKLHKIVNDNLTNSLCLKFQTKRKSKSSKNNNEEDGMTKDKIPFYFIFITCPYYDYDISFTTKQTILEFKNWELINKLLEKLVKFYVGSDISNLKEIIEPRKNVLKHKEQVVDDTRDQIKKIMDKILGNRSKKIGVSQMQNGVKGKLIKRKIKKKPLHISLSKIIPSKMVTMRKLVNNVINLEKSAPHQDLNGQFSHINNVSKKTKATVTKKRSYRNAKSKKTHIKLPEEEKVPNHECSNDFNSNVRLEKRLNNTKVEKNKKKITKNIDTQKCAKNVANEVDMNLLQEDCNNIDLNVRIRKRPENHKQKSTIISIKKQENKIKAIKKIKEKIGKTMLSKKPKQLDIPKKCDKLKSFNDPIINKFEKETGSVKRRCEMLAKEVDDLLSFNKKRKREVSINETVDYSNIIQNNRNISICKKVDEVVIYDYISIPPKFNPYSYDNHVWNGMKKNIHKSSYDLIKTVLETQQISKAFSTAEANSVKHHMTSQHYEITYPSNFTQPEPYQQDLRTATLPSLTFESHDYHNNETSHENNEILDNYEKKTRNLQFITKQSKDNFTVPKEKQKSKKINKNRFMKHISLNQPFEKKSTYLNLNTEQESSYTIKFSESNDRNILHKQNNQKSTKNYRDFCDILPNYFQSSTYTIEKSRACAPNKPCSKIDDTPTIITSIASHNCKINYRSHSGSNKLTDYYGSHKTYHIQENNNSVRYYDSEENERRNVSIESAECNGDENILKTNNFNVVFVSRSQHNNMTSGRHMDSLNVCETILQSQDVSNQELSKRQRNDSLFSYEFDINSLLCDRNAYSYSQQNSYRVMKTFNEMENNICQVDERNTKNVNPSNYDSVAILNEKGNFDNAKSPILTSKAKEYDEYNAESTLKTGNKIHIDTVSKDKEHGMKTNEINNFNFKTRLRFVPKGMSPIFENCQSRITNDYNTDNEYYEKTIYNNFANDIQINSEIFEAEISNVNNLATKEIGKVNSKLAKENASLIFNSDSLKTAHVLGQVDHKFIASKIKVRYRQSQEPSEYLVLFDQHAVHERIRLEKNLSDYLIGDQWRSITLDGISLKLSKDEMLYLHNHKDKFTQFGLQWTILNNFEVSINSIPEAILGKNPRQVEIVIEAVKNLISEEINAIKTQRGCVSLHPKSIMDLVFSEACRYAIKFGDRLSKIDCLELLQSLSECKTPFQCAHGRPVMAVLLNLKNEKREYKINTSKIYKFMKQK